MRHLVSFLVALMVLATPVQARLTLLPSDDTAGGGSGDIYWFMHFGSNQTTWPSIDSCLSSQGGGGSHRGCNATVAPDSRVYKTYFGTPFVRYLACSPSEDHTSWGSSASLTLAVFSVQGSNAEGNYVRTQIGGGLAFDETDGVGITKRLTINASAPIADATIQIRFTVVGGAPSVPVDNGLTCVIALTE